MKTRKLCDPRSLALAVLLGALAVWPGPALAQVVAAKSTENTREIGSWCDGQLAAMESLDRHFHQHPELSFQEEKTAQRVAEELRGVGATVTDWMLGWSA